MPPRRNSVSPDIPRSAEASRATPCTSADALGSRAKLRASRTSQSGPVRRSNRVSPVASPQLVTPTCSARLRALRLDMMQPPTLGPKPAPRRSIPHCGDSHPRKVSAAPRTTSHDAPESRSPRTAMPASRVPSSPRTPRNAAEASDRPTYVLTSTHSPPARCGPRVHGKSASRTTLAGRPLPRISTSFHHESNGQAATRNLQTSLPSAMSLPVHPRVHDRRHAQRLPRLGHLLSRRKAIPLGTPRVANHQQRTLTGLGGRLRARASSTIHPLVHTEVARSHEAPSARETLLLVPPLGCPFGSLNFRSRKKNGGVHQAFFHRLSQPSRRQAPR